MRTELQSENRVWNKLEHVQ